MGLDLRLAINYSSGCKKPVAREEAIVDSQHAQPHQAAASKPQSTGRKVQSPIRWVYAVASTPDHNPPMGTELGLAFARQD